MNTILQLRVHPSVIRLREKISNHSAQKKYEVDLTYITPRGRWYDISWKGQEEKSGGLVSNIGIHFFDMLGWVFGELQGVEVHSRKSNAVSGLLEYRNAIVRWYLSTNAPDLDAISRERKPYRSLTIDSEEFDFSDGFNDLHTLSYSGVLNGEGFGVAECRPSIETVHQIRNTVVKRSDYQHPVLRLIESGNSDS